MTRPFIRYAAGFKRGLERFRVFGTERGARFVVYEAAMVPGALSHKVGGQWAELGGSLTKVNARVSAYLMRK